MYYWLTVTLKGNNPLKNNTPNMELRTGNVRTPLSFECDGFPKLGVILFGDIYAFINKNSFITGTLFT